MDTVVSKKGAFVRVYLPPDANCLLEIADRCLRTKDLVNLLIIDKQPELQWLDPKAAREHCARGASIWEWASHGPEAPDVVLACAGDTATLETLAATSWLREHAPELRVRVVNVVDFMALYAPSAHPHGMTHERFVSLFGERVHVVFAFHGYAGAVHQALHGRPDPARFHVRGYREEGTTTTPFDMVVRNAMSRYHLAMEALGRSKRPVVRQELLVAELNALLKRHASYVREHFEDMPEVRDWRWSAP